MSKDLLKIWGYSENSCNTSRPALKPIGGYLVLYKYLSNIAASESSISVKFIYKYFLPYNKYSFYKFLKVFYYRLFKKHFYKWFDFPTNNKIRHQVETFNEPWEDYDLIIVSAVKTAIYINSLKKKTNVVYLIQHIEDWNVPRDVLIDTFKFPFLKIAVSNWIKNEVESTRNQINYTLSNPIEEIFTQTIKQENRIDKSILFMYHTAEWKGSKETIKTLEKLKKYDEGITCTCFSVYDKPHTFPSWINFVQNPSRIELVDLYNKHRIFLSLSYKEGFGLTAAEALRCGCCLVSTKNGGVEDFAVDNKTALLTSSPPNPKEVFALLKNLITDNQKIRKLALKGSEKVKNKTWKENSILFKKFLIEFLDENKKT